MVARGNNFRQIELDLVGSSTFGRYPKISISKSVNMFQSETFMVPYAGYKIAIDSTKFNFGKEGRGTFTSTKLNELVCVFDKNVYLVSISYNQQSDNVDYSSVTKIGELETVSGVVYITENNKPQILISDNKHLYIYDPSLPIATRFSVVGDLNFTPGYITVHDGYFIAAAKGDAT